ncbi:MAG TPA: GNAT family N-acetyltransferase, partial [Dissulfurispiraceae bacterium]|nr:GNAT family N-acetyltransferase [Dissulfurispiraceae bacterium]
VLLRPVKISDEQLLKEFFYSLSSDFMYRRFMSTRTDMHHDRLQRFVVIDYTREMAILAVIEEDSKEVIAGMGQYFVDEHTHNAEMAFVVRDEYQNRGIGTELVSYLTFIARKKGLLGFTAEVLSDNDPMLHLFETMFPRIEKKRKEEVYELKMSF